MSLALLLLACTSQYIVEGVDSGVGSDSETGETGETGEPEEEDFSAYDGARLVVTAPLSGSFLPYGEDAEFVAEVQDADGNTLDFEDIAWSTDLDDDWSITGAEIEDDSLDVGTHAITATAALPNGDRLASTMGGILVQSAYTGVYTGTITVDMTVAYNDTEYQAGCSGAITLIVDAYGEVAEGDAGCLLSLFGYDLDTSYVFELENDEGELSGDASLDLSWYQLDIEASGEIDEDGAATVSFADDIYGYGALEGTVDATRVSRDISEYDVGE